MGTELNNQQSWEAMCPVETHSARKVQSQEQNQSGLRFSPGPQWNFWPSDASMSIVNIPLHPPWVHALSLPGNYLMLPRKVWTGYPA